MQMFSALHLLQTLTKPNGMTLTQSYEQHRDLLTQMDYKRGNTLVARRSYQYDTLGRPTSRTLARQGATRNDVFNYNDRSESTRRLAGGLDKTADGVRRVSLWCSHSPAKQGEGTMGVPEANREARLPRRGEQAMGRLRVNWLATWWTAPDSTDGTTTAPLLPAALAWQATRKHVTTSSINTPSSRVNIIVKIWIKYNTNII